MGLLRLFLIVFLFACSTKTNTRVLNAKPLSPEETQELLSEVSGNWFYGQGVGDTALKTTAAIAFPPYAVVLLGNSLLGLSGYEKIGISDVVPGSIGKGIEKGYNEISSAPGRLTSVVSGKKYRTRKEIKKNMEKYLKLVHKNA